MVGNYGMYAQKELMRAKGSLGSRPSPYVRVLIARGWANRRPGVIRHVRGRWESTKYSNAGYRGDSSREG